LPKGSEYITCNQADGAQIERNSDQGALNASEQPKSTERHESLGFLGFPSDNQIKLDQQWPVFKAQYQELSWLCHSILSPGQRDDQIPAAGATFN